MIRKNDKLTFVCLICVVAFALLCIVPATATAMGTESLQFDLSWGSHGMTGGQFRAPSTCAIDNAGCVFVGDYNNHRVQKFTSNGTFLLSFGDTADTVDTGQMYKPAIDIDKDGNILATNPQYMRVQKYSPDGQYISYWSTIDGNGNSYVPNCVFVASTGEIYVGCGMDNQWGIFKYSANGTYLSTLGSFGQFSIPQQMAEDRYGNLYAVDYSNCRIQKFNSVGTFITTWGSYGSSQGQFNYPRGIAVTPDEKIVVSDTWNHRVQFFTLDGTFLSMWGVYGQDPGEFDNPGDIHFGKNGYVFITEIGWYYSEDDYNPDMPERIQKFTYTNVTPTITVEPTATQEPGLFIDDFSDPTLNPAWQFIENAPGRGSYSLNANSGYLRFIPDNFMTANSMTWWDPAWFADNHGAMGWTESPYLVRSFSGTSWTFETKADYHIHYQNSDGSTGGQSQYFYLGFGEGKGSYLSISRGGDCGYNCQWLSITIDNQGGAPINFPDNNIAFYDSDDVVTNGWLNHTYWYRITRNEQHVNVSISSDGTTYQPARSFDLPANIGTSQKIAIDAMEWAPAGSYADYDYVHITEGVPQENQTPGLPPVASFISDTTTTSIAPSIVNFTDTSQNSPTNWFWDFGDGTTATIQNPVHTFTTAWTYIVNLTATNSAGSDNSTQTIVIQSPVKNPVASFTANVTNGTAPLTVAFTDTSTNTPTTWNWDFGDGTTATVQNPVHTFTTADTFSVQLIVTNDAGSNSTVQQIAVMQSIPSPSGPFSEYSVEPGTVLLDHFNLSTNAAYTQSALSYVGGPEGLHQAAQFGMGQYAQYQLNSMGSEGTVEMWVNLSQYNAQIMTFNWNSANTVPSSGYIFHLTVNETGRIQIGGWSTSPGTWPEGVGAIPLHQWTHIAYTWGPAGSKIYINGELDSSTPTNPYPSFGSTTYAYLNYWGQKDLGEVDELRITRVAYTQFDTLTSPSVVAPVASFTSNVTNGTSPLTVAFTDTSTNTPTTWNWDFGDGTNATVQNPVHTLVACQK